MTLPQFRDDPEAAVEVARHAEAAGIDGAFVFDHLWPIAQPHRPAIHSWPLLGALAAETDQIHLGTLVARVGLLPDAVLVHALTTVHRMIGDRLIAGVGTGDKLSAAENIAYEIAYPPASERLAAMAGVCDALRRRGITTWVGGLSDATRRVAVDHADARNLWGADVAMVAGERDIAVTWGGLVKQGADLDALLGGLAAAGATWAVVAPVGFEWPDAVRAIAAAAGAVRR
jgi:Luciferase-like monooxygenase